MKNLVWAFTVAALLTEPSLAQPAANDELSSLIESEIEELIGLARDRGQERFLVDDLHRPLNLLVRDLWGGNKATSQENPLLNSECNERAVKEILVDAEHRHGVSDAIAKARNHFRERDEEMHSSSMTYADYLSHIAECRAFCGPLAAKLIGCHVEAVSQSQHEIVFFPINSYEIDAPSMDALHRTAESVHRSPGKNILLIGRGSRVGQLGYNRRLSGMRTRAVRETLVDLGIEPSRIKMLNFGYEPPQITAEIAAAYGISDIYESVGATRINQSVTIVVY